jgi:hypothetical protein
LVVDGRDLAAGGGDGVVPLPVPGVRLDRQQPQLLAGHGDPEGVGAGVEFGMHPQPGAGAGRGDGGHHDLVAGQRSAPPVHGDLGEQPVLDL